MLTLPEIRASHVRDMRDHANIAEAELITLVGFQQTREMIAEPRRFPQRGPDDMAHYLLVVICNRRQEAAAAERAPC